ERPVAGILLTHGHFDHVLAADEVADETSSYLYMSQAELDISPQLVTDIEERYGIKVTVPRVDFKLYDGDLLDLAGLRVEVMLTPGHTVGSVGYLVWDEAEPEQKHYFSGDTLFARDVGRTDLLGGDEAAMQQSIERIARELAPSTKVYPGHGPATSIERESRANSWWPA
ncbi:MAG: MBL fold metallo-hydrolase, partial [Coriobacteriia bacterium]|nr:MBL fold metallo-hydrolase [Coriobacteriia bacterium]